MTEMIELIVLCFLVNILVMFAMGIGLLFGNKRLGKTCVDSINSTGEGSSCCGGGVCPTADVGKMQ